MWGLRRIAICFLLVVGFAVARTLGGAGNSDNETCCCGQAVEKQRSGIMNASLTRAKGIA